MKWQKKGLIFCPDGSSEWANHSVMTPTPIIINNSLRLYCGFRDKEGVSRIGYIDLNPENPSIVQRVSTVPVLGVGDDGAFDDNGIILGDLTWVGNELRMYYVGFQKVSNSVGNGWETINGIPYPKYDIRYTESSDGTNFNESVGVHCLGVQPGEYRIGRPRVREINNGFEMRFTYDTKEKAYGTGYAVSADGVNWERKDELTGISTSESGWDSDMICYPAIIKVKKREFMFYSGNGMGKTGVGYAELVR